MGVSIRGTYHKTNSPYSLDMGYASFFRLRCVIAKHLDEEFGEHYKGLARIMYTSEEDVKAFDDKTAEILARKGLENQRWKIKVLDFLFESDVKGCIPYSACKRIYNLIKEEPDEARYGYEGWGDKCSTMRDFKNLLLDVYVNKGRVKWLG